MIRVSLLLLLIAPGLCFAQSYSCNGVIQNWPCGSTPKRVDTSPKKKKSSSSASADSLEKRKQISEFQNLLTRAREKYRLRFDGSYPQQYCLLSETTATDCTAEIERFTAKLHRQIELEESLRPDPPETDEGKIEQANTQVVILRDRRSRYWLKKQREKEEEEELSVEDPPPAESLPQTKPTPKKRRPASVSHR
jgi:hypothetical protein